MTAEPTRVVTTETPTGATTITRVGCTGCRTNQCGACHTITQPGDGCCCGRLIETPC